MEAKLKEYRALRRRQQFIDNIKQKLDNSKEKLINFLVPTSVEMDKKEEEVILVCHIYFANSSEFNRNALQVSCLNI